MKTCLVDENLPATLRLPALWSQIHVCALGRQLTDSQIWRYAAANGCVILTKDADFYDSILLNGAPPKVVWVRLGNCKRKDLETRVEATWPSVEELLQQFDLVEIHPNHVEGILFGTNNPATE